MSFLDDFIATLSGYQLFENSGLDYFNSLLIFLFTILISLFIKKILLGRANAWLDTTDRFEELEVSLEKIDSAISLFLIFTFALDLSIQSLIVAVYLSLVISFTFYILLVIALLKLLFASIDFLISFSIEKADDSTDNILHFLRIVIKGIVAVIIVIWLMSNLGIDTTTFIASLGVFALAIAFGLQNIISDVFAALTIYLDKPFEIGDTIELGSDMGKVEAIGIRSTKIRTLAGHLLIVSNRELIDERINNYYQMERRRVSFILKVHPNTPLNKLKRIPKMIEKIIESTGNTTFNRTYLSNLNDFSFDFDIVYYVESRSYDEYLKTHQEVNIKIIEKLEKENISIPYPTQTVIVQQSKEV